MIYITYIVDIFQTEKLPEGCHPSFGVVTVKYPETKISSGIVKSKECNVFVI